MRGKCAWQKSAKLVVTNQRKREQSIARLTPLVNSGLRHTYSLYQAGSWSNGSFSYASVSFQGSGDTATSYGLTGTTTSSGSADMNYSSSGVAASGANVNMSVVQTGAQTWSGSGRAIGNPSRRRRAKDSTDGSIASMGLTMAGTRS